MNAFVEFNLGRILLATATYGAYLVTAGVALHLLLRHGRGYSGRGPLVTYTAYMLVVVTSWYLSSVWLAASVLSALLHDGSSDVDSECYPANIVMIVCTTLQVLGSDALLLYRALVIWRNDRRVTIPLILIYTISLGSGVAKNVYCAKAERRANNFNKAANLTFTGAFMVFNIIVPLLISIKFWKLRRTATVASTLRILLMTILVWIISAAAVIPVSVPRNGSLAGVAVEDVVQDIIILLPAFIVLHVALQQHRTAGPDGVTTRESPRAVMADDRFSSCAIEYPLPMHEPARSPTSAYV